MLFNVKPKDLQRLDKPLKQRPGEHYETWLARDNERASKKAMHAETQRQETPHTTELLEPGPQVPRTTAQLTPSPQSSPFEMWPPIRD